MAHVLMVDDERSFVTVARDFLENQGHVVTGAFDGASAIALMNEQSFDVVLTDLRMEPLDGMAVLDAAGTALPGTPVIMLTGHGSKEEGVAALERGAVAYLNKPYSFAELSLLIIRSVGEVRTRRENRVLRRQTSAAASHPMIGSSAPMSALKDMIERVAGTDATVLIRGESGTGKEVAARTIHAASERASGPFIAVNCAAITGSLLESELFGYRKGAFTGADTDRDGLFLAADGGTIFLDEIGEAAPAVQAKLLRVLQERKINPVGDPRERAIDVRVLAATNRPLEEAIRNGSFREDLYYRLAVFPLEVPPLRNRRDDIAELAACFLNEAGRVGETPSPAVLGLLKGYDWPGNIRELRNVIERARILAGSGPVEPTHIVLDTVRGRGPDESGPADLNLENHERRLIGLALQRAAGNKTEAARLLGITRRTLYSRLNLLGLDGEGQADPGAPGRGDRS